MFLNIALSQVRAAPAAPAFEVIPSRAWVRDDGRSASIYGAVPWVADAERPRWSIVSKGWTVRNPLTGQVGIGRPACLTHAEAVELAARLGRPSSIGIGD